MDETETADLAMQFLQRVQLQGQEVPAFNAVMGWLDKVRLGATDDPQPSE